MGLCRTRLDFNFFRGEMHNTLGGRDGPAAGACWPREAWVSPLEAFRLGLSAETREYPRAGASL